MPKNMLIIVILIMFVPCHTYSFTLDKPSQVHNRNISPIVTQKSPKEPQSHSTFSVINIIIDSITTNMIYSKDGKSFVINDSTTIINNHDPKVKVEIGELFFKNGLLETIIIK
jgi:hypothetical protein